ncbi:MAG: hypothetical protein HC892_20180 [Saprospiraceae bacterium]|nr:hypothetical protein [Saprospiraceae bacterium]
MRYLLLLLSLVTTLSLEAQKKNVFVSNPSFEGEPSDATVPVGWFACAPGSTPDIMPGPWGVYQEASEGNTYIGLITRDDNTFESIGQRLSSPFEANECYAFHVDLSQSNTYAGYSNPIKLRIWAGAERCTKQQLIAETDYINHRDWKTYHFKFTAAKTYNYIVIEAFYTTRQFSYRGNILLDNLSIFKWCARA